MEFDRERFLKLLFGTFKSYGERGKGKRGGT